MSHCNQVGFRYRYQITLINDYHEQVSEPLVARVAFFFLRYVARLLLVKCIPWEVEESLPILENEPANYSKSL